MRSTSCTTPSEARRGAARSAVCAGTAFLLAVALAGCAMEPLTNGGPSKRERTFPVAEKTEPSPMVMTLEYGNQSTHASMQFDLASDEVLVEMTRSPRRDTVKSDSVIIRDTSRQATSPQASTPAMNGDSLLDCAKRIVDSAVRASNRQPTDTATRSASDTAGVAKARPAFPDSVTRLVVGEIRKAQESFYKGRYQEASEHASRSIAIHPTPEGYALAGSICWVQKDKEGARKQWLQARAMDPDFPGVAAMLDSQEAAP